MAEEKATGQVFNVGGTEEISILELAEKIKALTKSASEIQFIPFGEAYDKNFEDMGRRVPCIDKARSVIGFNPTSGIDNILKSIIASRSPQGS